MQTPAAAPRLSGLFLTAVEPENRNQPRSTAEPWLGLAVCVVLRSGDELCSMEKGDRCALSLSASISAP